MKYRILMSDYTRETARALPMSCVWPLRFNTAAEAYDYINKLILLDPRWDGVKKTVVGVPEGK